MAVMSQIFHCVVSYNLNAINDIIIIIITASLSGKLCIFWPFFPEAEKCNLVIILGIFVCYRQCCSLKEC